MADSLLVSGLKQKDAVPIGEEDGDAIADAVRSMAGGRMKVPPSSRLAQIIAWLQRCPDGPLIVFGEPCSLANGANAL